MNKMNKQLKILIFGIAFLLLSVMVTDQDVQQVFGVDNVFVPSSSNVPKQTTINKSVDGVEIVKIQRVVDGDTVELEDGRKVRLLYIDTPETVKVGTPIQCFGPEASKYTKEMLTGKFVQMVADNDPQDRYARELRIIYLEGKDTTDIAQSLNADLVKRGYARVKTYSPNKKYEKELVAIENQVKADNIGIWKNCPNPFVQ